MKQEGNMINDWLDEFGNPEIEELVKQQAYEIYNEHFMTNIEAQEFDTIEEFIDFNIEKTKEELLKDLPECNHTFLSGWLAALSHVKVNFINKSNSELIVENEKKIVGTLTRKMGFNGYCPAEIGTAVHEIDGQYMVEYTIEDTEKVVPMFYSKNELLPYIDKVIHSDEYNLNAI